MPNGRRRPLRLGCSPSICKAASLVTEPGTWEHPSWARDRRHLVAERDGALFLIDTLENGDKPVKLFSLQGKCTMPSWQR